MTALANNANIKLILFMIRQISKEENSTQNNQGLEVQSKHFDTVSHFIAFNQQRSLITIGNEGEVNLYLRNSQGSYEHKSTNKIFCCPIIAYDLMQEGHYYKLLLVSFDNRIAACRVEGNEYLIVYRYFKVQQKQSIVSCIWGNLENEIILGGLKGHLIIIDIVTNTLLRECNFEETPLKLLRFGKSEVYLSTQSEISKLLFQKQIESVVIINEQMLGSGPIIDFAISQQTFYNSLVILTQRRIYFLQMGQLKAKPQSLNLKTKVKGGRLGWGKDFNQIGIYETSKKTGSVQTYSKNLNGIWQIVHY